MRLSHARIGAALMARDLTAEVVLAIDLGGARAGTLDDVGFPAGWGVGRDRKGTFCNLNLDGFVYDRFGHLPADETSGIAVALSAFGRWVAHLGYGHSASWAVRLAHRMLRAQRAPIRQRLAWVQRQQRSEGEFHPQPVPAFGEGSARARALPCGSRGGDRRAMGDAVFEPPHARAAMGLGGVFGFGLSPVRATATVAVLLAIGTAGVWWAWKKADVLVINYSYTMTEVANCPGVPSRRKGTTYSERPTLRCHRHPAAVLRDGHDGAGDGAASDR